MKNLFLIPVVMCAFIMTACGQNEVALADNSNAIDEINKIEKSHSNDSNLSPKVKKLKAEFLKEIKKQYFIDRGIKVPSSLEIILMSDVYGTIYTYFTFDGKMSRANKDNIGRYFVAPGPTSVIKSRHKSPKNVIYQK